MRIATVNVGCVEATEVVEDFYSRYDKDPRSVTGEVRADGFRCAGGLAFSELQCQRGSQSIFASSRPEDHPAKAHGPKELLPVGFNCQVLYINGLGNIFYHFKMGCYQARKLATYAVKNHRHPNGYRYHPSQEPAEHDALRTTNRTSNSAGIPRTLESF